MYYKIKPVLTCFCIWVILSMSGCATMVSTNTSRSVDFNKFKTFAWTRPDIQTGENPVYKNAIVHRNLKFAVENELFKRGLQVDTLHPDLLIGYHVYTEKKQVSNVGFYGSPYYSYGPYFNPYAWGGGWWGGGWVPQTFTYTAGTLVLDFIDNHTHELIWSGSIEGKVDNVKNLSAKAEKAVETIMKKYPLKVKNDQPL
jgi:hypothetical protein